MSDHRLKLLVKVIGNADTCRFERGLRCGQAASEVVALLDREELASIGRPEQVVNTAGQASERLDRCPTMLSHEEIGEVIDFIDSGITLGRSGHCCCGLAGATRRARRDLGGTATATSQDDSHHEPSSSHGPSWRASMGSVEYVAAQFESIGRPRLSSVSFTL